VPNASLGWGRKVARFPAEGVLLVATDLQGNYEDYEALKAIYNREEEQGNKPVLLLCGDLVHGPGGEYAQRSRWPDFLGTFYVDRSRELILDYEQFAETAQTVALLGNHEHAHIGGPVVRKFHQDEAAVLDEALGDDAPRIHDMLRSFPLIGVAPCGATFTHGAPRATERDLDAFETLRYSGYENVDLGAMHDTGTVGNLLWARYADPVRAREFLTATRLATRMNAFVAFGHDVVREGYEKIGAEQICVSTSFGCDDENKVYLRLDLSAEYKSVHDLKLGEQILRLYPDA